VSYPVACIARRSDTLAVLLTLAVAPRPVEWRYPQPSQYALDGAPIVTSLELPDVSLTWGYVEPALAQQLTTLLGMVVPIDLWLPTDGAPGAPNPAHVPYAFVRGWFLRPERTTSHDWASRGRSVFSLRGATIVP
jgi:hypothetical protein